MFRSAPAAGSSFNMFRSAPAAGCSFKFFGFWGVLQGRREVTDANSSHRATKITHKAAFGNLLIDFCVPRCKKLRYLLSSLKDLLKPQIFNAFFSKLSTVVYPSNMTSFRLKLWENAFQTIPNVSFFHAENVKQFFLLQNFE